MLNRWIEEDLLDVLERRGRRLHRLLAARPGHAHRRATSTASRRTRAPPRACSSARTCSPRSASTHVRALNEIAQRRGQTLAQMAVAWVLRDPRVTSALIGASSVEQLDDTLGALDGLDFSDDELREIDEHAVDAGINLWESSSSSVVSAAVPRPEGAAPSRMATRTAGR